MSLLEKIDQLTGPVMKMAIPKRGPDTNLQNNTITDIKYLDFFTQADKDDNKAHTLIIKLLMNSNISLAFYLFPDLSCSNDCGVLACLHKRPKVLARYYVTSHWQ